MNTFSKLINPSQEKLVEDDRTMQRLARSAQGGYGAPLPVYDAPLPSYTEPAPPPAPLPLMPYRYGYAVQDTDCNDFNQQEQSDGDQVGTKVSAKFS